jgi:branched-chain amino acid transport system substrate-binding protein
VVLAANQDEGLPVLRQLRTAKLGIPILAGDGLVGAERTNPALMEGVYVSSAYLIGDARERNRLFVAAYRKAYPDAGAPDQGAAASYDAVYLLARAIQEAGADRAGVKTALGRIGSASLAYDGVVGTVAFDQNGDAPTLQVQVGVARRGVLVPAEREH